jgi:hypothetical protein
MKSRGLQAWKICRVAAIVLVAATPWGACATDALGATDWATGTRLQKQLARPVGISWSGNPLRQALGGLSRAQHVAVLIDRRVDPGQEVDLQFDGLPLQEALREIARDRQLGVSLLGPVAYFGPPEVSSRLRTIAALRTEEIRRLPASVQRKFLLPKQIAWDDLATPRDLLAQLAAQSGLEIEGADRVPHDLWAAADLPPLSLVNRLTLILVQFNLTFRVSPEGKTVSLVPLPDEVALVRSYPGGPQPEATAKKYALLAPEAQIKVVGTQVYVKGLLETQERIAGALRHPRPHTPQPDHGNGRKERVTGRVAGQLDQLLEGLAARFRLELRIDHQALKEAGISLQQNISVKVDNATVDELFREVVKPAGLSFRRRGNVVEISPAR